MTGKPNPPKIYASEKTGRPSKFTQERRAAIVDAISHRIPYEYAAEANGISERVLYYWKDLGKEHQEKGIDSDYSFFLQDIKRAEMTRMREHSDIIAARPERWQADAWMLERRWHKHYGPNAQLNELNIRLAKLEIGGSYEVSSNEEDGKEG